MDKEMLNKTITLDINDLTHEGKGVGRYEGKVVFVEGALPEEKVLCKIEKEKKKFLEGNLIKILEYSSQRTPEKCEIAKDCGGCQIQHLNYEAQLSFKEKLVADAFQKIGELSNYNLCSIVQMDNPWNYRNKVIFQVKKTQGELRLGFFKAKSNTLIPYTNCLLIDEKMQQLAADIEKTLNEHKKENFKIYRVIIRRGIRTGEILIALVGTGGIEKLKIIASELAKKNNNIKAVVHNTVKSPKEPWGKKTENLYGENYITEKIKDIEYRISAASFFQINTVQAEKLYDKVLEFSGLSSKENVWDIYCGTGSISLFLAQESNFVYGIEENKEAVQDAQENARINGINNVKFVAKKAEEYLPGLLEKEKPDVIVVDPPRRGCHEEVLHVIKEAKPEKVIYVSCDPATLARDLNKLTTSGYTVQEVQPVDMFPQTGHVEMVVKIKRNKT